MSDTINIHHYDNGLVLLSERMEWLESAAFSLFLPARAIRAPAGGLGVRDFTPRTVQRGCGERDSRQFISDLENLGVDYSSSVAGAHARIGGAMLADQLDRVLAIFSDVVLRPHLPAEQLEDARQGCLQELYSLEDDLAQRAMQELRQQMYGDPWGRRSVGLIEDVERITLEDVQHLYHSSYRPNGAILSVAGNVDFARLRDRVGELLGDWQPMELAEPNGSTPERKTRHLDHSSNQMHITVGFPAVPYNDPLYYQARGAIGVLSDGMSSRLFTEVREKRGLCYAVYAVCHTLRDRGHVLCYAGTTTERAQETLDVLIHELRTLADGVHDDELQRLQARLKSSLIMQQESSASRSGSMAADWYYLGRVQSLDEVSRVIDELSVDSINEYLRERPPGDFVVVTLGQEPLETPVEVP